VLPVILLTSVNLASVTGATRRPPLVIDPLTLVATIAAFALAAVAATLIAIALARRASLAIILRTGGRE
jgi:putative ABC transport system permease protein